MPFFDSLQSATATEREALFGVPVVREAPGQASEIARHRHVDTRRALPGARSQHDEVQHALA